MWKGSISFGMVSIPVKLYTAVTEQNVAFTTLHAGCNAKVRQELRCTACDAVVADEDKLRGFDVGSQFVVIGDDELADLPVPTKQTISVHTFVKIEDVDPVYFDKTYAVLPETMGLMPYTLIAHAMNERGVVGVGKVTIRTRESVCLIRPTMGGMQLTLLHYADEVRDVEPVIGYPVQDADLAVALQVVDALQGEWRPANYKNEYRESVHSLVQSKLANGVVPKATAAAGPPPIVDFMAAMRATLAAQHPAPETPVQLAKARSKRRKEAV